MSINFESKFSIFGSGLFGCLDEASATNEPWFCLEAFECKSLGERRLSILDWLVAGFTIEVELIYGNSTNWWSTSTGENIQEKQEHKKKKKASTRNSITGKWPRIGLGREWRCKWSVGTGRESSIITTTRPVNHRGCSPSSTTTATKKKHTATIIIIGRTGLIVVVVIKTSSTSRKASILRLPHLFWASLVAIQISPSFFFLRSLHSTKTKLAFIEQWNPPPLPKTPNCVSPMPILWPFVNVCSTPQLHHHQRRAESRFVVVVFETRWS